jgi:hypothetical protein
MKRLSMTLIFSLLPLNLAVAVELAAQNHPTLVAQGHPRLFMSGAEIERLRTLRAVGAHAAIWKNVAASAEWCLTQKPRTEWIAPIADDPNYENLYDRFYAMMQDMAITEHLAFAYVLSGEEKYGAAAHDWTLGCCRAWKPDADAKPDGGKAYAVMRLLKGVATGYDLAYDRFTPAERDEIRAMLSTTARNYFKHYFSTPDHSGPEFHTHHAVVEYSSFGVASLALLGEVDDAGEWVNATTKKFEEHLLPTGLADDGAQVEGATFWASTMHYRLFYMDALRRVTGVDLFKKYEKFMNADLALASIACESTDAWDEPNQAVIFSPSYGQLNYYAPVLVCLAREYKKPIYQRLASWDHSLGSIQKTHYVTPNRREQLLFELGGYAYVWFDAEVGTDAGEAKMSYAFPSVGQVYARQSWGPGGMLVAVDKFGQVQVHAGGTPVIVASGPSNEPQPTPELKDDGKVATIDWKGPDNKSIAVRLDRVSGLTVSWKGLPASWSFSALRVPQLKDGALVWPNGVRMRAVKGAITRIDPEGNAPLHAVGNGKLALFDPSPKKYPFIYVAPDASGELELEILENRE